MPDLSDYVNWSETDANNNQAPPNGWPEGMMPSGVNDAARADRGALKRFWNKINPVQAITPSGGVFTFTTGNSVYPTAYVNSEIYSFFPISSSVGSDQFQANALGPKPILRHDPSGTAGYVAIAAYDILAQRAAQLVYDSALNAGSGAFILLNPFVPIHGDGTGTGLTVPGNITTTGDLYGHTLNASGGITVSAGGVNIQSGGLAVSGNINTANDIYGHTLNASGGITVSAGGVNIQSGGLSVTGVTNINGATGIIGGLTVDALHDTGNLQVDGAVGVNGQVTVGYIHDTGGLQVDGALNCNGALTANNITTAAYLNVGSYVNIGTTLSVTGGMGVTGAATLGGLTVNQANINQITAQSGAGGLQVHNGLVVSPDGSQAVCAQFNASIQVTGDVGYTGSLLHNSDRRLKTEIKSYTRGLAAIRELRPTSWQWNGSGGMTADGRRHYGLIADEVETVLPEMVSRRHVYATLENQPLLMALITAVQELAAKVDALETKLALPG